MARSPKPWFWKARNGWFVTIDGVRHFLAREKAEAFTRFHQLMAEPRMRLVRSDSVAAIIDAFMEFCHKERAPDTYEWYRYLFLREDLQESAKTSSPICSMAFGFSASFGDN